MSPILWIAHTHLMDAWESTQRIGFSRRSRGAEKRTPWNSRKRWSLDLLRP